jgi:hypothetical protein
MGLRRIKRNYLLREAGFAVKDKEVQQKINPP